MEPCVQWTVVAGDSCVQLRREVRLRPMGYGGTIFAAQPRKLVEAAGIEPASENLYPEPLHAYPVPVFLAPVGQEPARSRREPSP